MIVIWSGKKSFDSEAEVQLKTDGNMTFNKHILKLVQAKNF